MSVKNNRTVDILETLIKSAVSILILSLVLTVAVNVSLFRS